MAAADNLRFSRFPLFNNYALIDSQYAQGVIDGDTVGFMRGIGAAQVVFDPTNRWQEGFRTGLALSVPQILVPLVVYPLPTDESDDAYEDGSGEGFRRGFVAGIATSGGGSSETTPPAVGIVSPTPGAAPGAVGGFSGDFAIASATAIVLTMSDASGIGAQVVYARFRNYPKLGEIAEVVYAMGNFVGNYVKLSSQAFATGTLTLTCRRDNGWPVGTGVAGDITFTAIAVDVHGNVT